MTQKLKLGSYPYTYVRVQVMRSKILREQDYAQLLKMSTAETIRFLSDSEYRKAVDELGLAFEGVDLLDHVLAKHLSNVFDKIRRISPDDLRTLVEMYLMRFDNWNVKAMLRSKFINLAADEMKKMLIPCAQYSEAQMLAWYREADVPSLLIAVPMLAPRAKERALRLFTETGSLVVLENALDRQYFRTLRHFSSMVPEEGELLREFITLEAYTTNIMTILRFKREGMPSTDIKEYLIPNPQRINEYRAMIASEIQDVHKHIRRPRVRRMVEEGMAEFEKTRSLVPLERAIGRYLLMKTQSITHRHVMSIDIVLSYLFAKEIEVKNLRLIMKGKALGMTESFIQEGLII
ncbi:MAG: V-type ATPase subunit [Nanoarchaeota archaeon]